VKHSAPLSATVRFIRIELVLTCLYVYNIGYQYTLEAIMRTNVVIDDNLMTSALEISGMKTKKDAIEAGLKLLVKFNRQAKIRDLRGKLKWIGNLDEMRTDK
jgi:Arc/MetJ family transcription regulator